MLSCRRLKTQARIQGEIWEKEQQKAAGRFEAQAGLEERDCLSTAAINMSQQQGASHGFAQGLEQAWTGPCTRPSPCTVSS